MAQILVRDLDKGVVDRLKKRARKKGRSLQSEVKLILERAAYEPRVDADTARRLSADFRRRFKGREFPKTIDLIQEDRQR